MKIGNYDFEGPFLLQDWSAPRKAGVYVILHKNTSGNYTVDYVGESENLDDRGFPWNHHKSNCWISEAGGKTNVYIAVRYMPGSTYQQRATIESQLIKQYNPPCCTSSNNSDTVLLKLRHSLPHGNGFSVLSSPSVNGLPFGSFSLL